MKTSIRSDFLFLPALICLGASICVADVAVTYGPDGRIPMIYADDASVLGTNQPNESISAILSSTAGSYSAGNPPAEPTSISTDTGIVFAPAPPAALGAAVYPNECGSAADMKFDNLIVSNTRFGKYTNYSLSLSAQGGLSLGTNGRSTIINKTTLDAYGMQLATNGGYTNHADTTRIGIGSIGLYSRSRTLSGNFDSTIITSNSMKLSGTIQARKIIVTNLPWADYVFNKDYKLMPLPEVKEYIKANGRLPGVTAGTDLEKNGASIADIAAMQQKKIEELTLYVLELKDRIDNLEK